MYRQIPFSQCDNNVDIYRYVFVVFQFVGSNQNVSELFIYEPFGNETP